MKLSIMIPILMLTSLACFSQLSFTNSINQNTSSRIDSIVFSKDDAFFGYSVYDVFLNSKGALYIHAIEDFAYQFSDSRKTQLGFLKKTQLGKNIVSLIFNKADNLLEDRINSEYSVMRSDQTTAKIFLYNKGVEIKTISDYGMQGDPRLVDFYNIMDSLKQEFELGDWESWDSENLDVRFIDSEKVVDSIKFVEHLKSEGSYYRNGIARSITLKGNEVNKFIDYSKKLVKSNPYNDRTYEILTSKVDKYSMFIYYKTGEVQWVKYNGKRFRKKTFLDFKTRKNIVTRLLRKRDVDSILNL